MKHFAEILKSLGMLPVKVLINFLNFFPSPIYEATSIKQDKRLREIHTILQGKRRLKFGCAVIARMRGVVFPVDHGRGKFEGIWPEDFEDIVKKWSL